MSWILCVAIIQIYHLYFHSWYSLIQVFVLSFADCLITSWLWYQWWFYSTMMPQLLVLFVTLFLLFVLLVWFLVLMLVLLLVWSLVLFAFLLLVEIFSIFVTFGIIGDIVIGVVVAVPSLIILLFLVPLLFVILLFFGWKLIVGCGITFFKQQ